MPSVKSSVLLVKTTVHCTYHRAVDLQNMVVFTDEHLDSVNVQISHSMPCFIRTAHSIKPVRGRELLIFFAFSFQNRNTKLNTSQRHCWNEPWGKALTTQEMRLSAFVFPSCVLCAACTRGRYLGRQPLEVGDFKTPAAEFTALSCVLCINRLVRRPLATFSRHLNPN